MITCAEISWKDNTPYSTDFGDFYFNSEQSSEDCLYVYINANRIAERINANHSSLTLAETGFGTGLNFLLTAKLWTEKASDSQHLHFISVEKQPLNHSDFKRALKQWADLTPFSSKLLDQYPYSHTGFHRLHFPDERITLTLIFGDAVGSYASLKASVDAWYLDGFSPSKNPDMWSPALFREIARLSKPGATFSTFTSAGIVRKGLEAVGFEVKKQPGFGKKREMCLGTFVGNKAPIRKAAPWFLLPPTTQPDAVTVIGGGLAGCSTAYALAQRGIKVTLIEKEQNLASGGSGNRQGALYAKLPITPTKQGAFHLTGFLYTVNFLKQKDPTRSFWSQCGVVQLATKDSEKIRQHELIENGHYSNSLVQHKSAEELTNISGSRISNSGLFFPDAGWVSPVDFCHLLADHPNINVEQHNILTIDRSESSWKLTSSDSKHLLCSHLVICNAELSNRFKQTEHLPLKSIRGQVSITDNNQNLPKLKTVICGEGYISPAQNGRYCFGATFDLKGKQPDVTQADHDKNLEKLQDALPDFHNALLNKQEPLSGRTAFRCSTPDYMPVVGPAPVFADYVTAFGHLRKDKNWRFDDVQPNHYPNLYINTGHGSKGLITCPISAELLASIICNEPLPLPKTLIDAINPSRFIIKNLIRRAI